MANEVVKLYKLLTSWDVSSTFSIKMSIMCLLTCAAYLVTFRIDTMCTKVSYCVGWISVSWFSCSQMLLTSFVVAVTVSHRRALPKKGNRLLLWWVLLCMCPLNEGPIFRRLIAEMMVGFQELYISLIVVSSTWSGDNKWEGAAGWWFRNSSSFEGFQKFWGPFKFYLLPCE